MLALDWTFAFHIILFLVIWIFFRHFLFEPQLAMLTQRKQRSEGAIREAQQIKTDAEAIEKQYQSRLAQARTSYMQHVDTVYREADEQAREILASARSEALAFSSTMREQLQKEIVAGKTDLETRIPEFAHRIAEKLLGRLLT